MLPNPWFNYRILEYTQVSYQFQFSFTSIEMIYFESFSG